MQYKDKLTNLVIFSACSPFLYGIYYRDELIESFRFEGRATEGFIEVFEKYLCFNIRQIFYAKGPGSFTAIKLTHIFLQTWHIIKEVELFSVDSFYFNQGAPIHAFGNQYFVKMDREIFLQTFDVTPHCSFVLPSRLCCEDFTSQNEPLYVLPPI